MSRGQSRFDLAMPQRAALFLLALVAVTAGLLLFWRTSAPTATSPAFPQPSTQPAAAPPALVPDPLHEARPRTERQALPAPAGIEPGAEEMASAARPFVPGPSDGFGVRVRFADGEPAAGARVESLGAELHLSPGRIALEVRAERAARQNQALPPTLDGAHADRRFRADDEGWVRVPDLGLGQMLLAFAERDEKEWVASLHLWQARRDQPVGEIELVLEPRVELEVELVDARGEPAPGVVLHVIGDLPMDHGRWPNALRRSQLGRTAALGARTDGAGRARLAERAIRFRDLDRPALYVALPFDPPIVPFLEEAPGGGPWRIVLPPTGSVHVQGARSEVFLQVEGSGARPSSTSLPIDGRAEFPLVGLGLNLRAQDRSASAAPRHFAGPTEPGERIKVTLESKRLWRLNLVDAAGQALADRTVRVSERSGRSAMSGYTLTDEAGGLDFVPRLEVGETWRLELEVGNEGPESSHHLNARMDSLPPEEGEVQVVLYPAPHHGTGRVLNDVGDAVANAEVFLVPEDQLFVANNIFGRGPFAVTDNEGRFELAGPLPDLFGDLALVRFARRPGYPDSLPVPHRPGEDSVLVLARPAEVSFEIHWPEGFAIGSLSFELRSPHGTRLLMDSPGEADTPEPGVRSRRWHAMGAPSGDIELHAHSQLDGAWLAAWPLHAPAGQRAELDPINLYGAVPMAATSIHLADPEGVRHVAITAAGPGGVHTIRVPPDARFLPRPTTRLELTAEAFGHLPLELAWDGAPLHLDFTTGWRLPVRLGPGFEVPEDWAPLMLIFSVSQPGAGASSRQVLELSGSGPHEVRVETPGVLHYTPNSPNAPQPWGPSSSLELDLERLESGAPLVLEFDRERWQAWLDRQR